jgi:hypothetical protein
MKCSCLVETLFARGCKCGAIEFEKSPHVWSNGIIYTIATNEDQATKLSKDYLSTFSEYTDEWIMGDGWTFLPDDFEISLQTEESDDYQIKTAQEWIEQFGLGYLGVII